MKLLGRTSSLNVQKVLWFLEELEITYAHIELGGRFGGLQNPEFATLNPLKKVPVLVDGEKSIWESHAILRYLAACYGGGNWYPDDPYERSLYERWLDWSHVVFQPAFMGTFWGFYRKPPEKRDMEAVNQSLVDCMACLDVVNNQLDGSAFLAGPSMSLADIAVGTIMYRLTSQGLDVALPERVGAWYARLCEREGYARWVMSDFSELQGREQY
ncbi:MAG: glutathione S-transferase family protein [Pseudomonadota bacterium]